MKKKPTPRPDCKTCDGTGTITVPVYDEPNNPKNFYRIRIDIEDCPECEEVNEIENEQIEKL